MLDVDTIAQLLQTTVTPIIAISGLGLFILVVQNRWVAITDTIRALNRDRLGLSREHAAGGMSEAEGAWAEARMANLREQISVLERRGALVKDALQYIFLAILLFVIASLVMLISQTFDLNLSHVVLLLFVLGLLMVFLTCTNLVREVRTSYEAVEIELRMKTAGELK
jgi:hypothetical protein